jgi:hypothetical protein
VSSITIHTATREDVEHISDNLRLADFEEFVCATGRHPHGLLVNRALASGAYVARIDGVPAAVYGCVPQGRTGAPWLLGTDAIQGFAAAKALVVIGQLLFPMWARQYPDGLRHRASAANPLHLRYIAALGCTIDPPKPHGPMLALFREFHYV